MPAARPPTSVEHDPAERIVTTAGQVATVIVDVSLPGRGTPITVARLDDTVTVLRGRVYTHVDPVRDVWEVAEPGAITVLGGDVLASGPAGPVRVILSVVGEQVTSTGTTPS